MFKSKKKRAIESAIEHLSATLRHAAESLAAVADDVRVSRQEIRRDYICGGWTTPDLNRGLIISKLPEGFNAAIYTPPLNRKRTRLMRVFVRVDGDVLKAVTTLVAELKAGGLPPEEETLKLKMLIHLVGDMHCPMHAGRLSDIGGNLRPVLMFGKKTNLHSAWDTAIPEAARKWSYTEWQEQIDRLTDDEAMLIQAGEPYDWLKETHAICVGIYEDSPEGTKISYDYVYKYTPVIELQFLRGGYRLARLLNEIYR